MDKVKALRTFACVAESKSFSSAARKLNVSAPSVTRIIGELESSLKATLLHRTTRIVTLTDSGQCYYKNAKQILDAVEIADNTVRGDQQIPRGELNVTAPRMFGGMYITPIITEYLDLYPDVKIKAIFMNNVVNMYQEDLDIAVRIGELEDSSLMATRVGTVSFQVCGSQDYFNKHGIPQHPQDLENHKTLGLCHQPYQSDWMFKDRITFRPNHRVTFNSIPACLEGVKSGWGLARVLSYQIGPSMNSGQIKTALHNFAPDPMPIHLLHKEGRRSSAKVRAFIELAKARLKANPHIN